jgi:hypothetical protein
MSVIPLGSYGMENITRFMRLSRVWLRTFFHSPKKDSFVTFELDSELERCFTIQEIECRLGKDTITLTNLNTKPEGGAGRPDDPKKILRRARFDTASWCQQVLGEAWHRLEAQVTTAGAWKPKTVIRFYYPEKLVVDFHIATGCVLKIWKY